MKKLQSATLMTIATLALAGFPQTAEAAPVGPDGPTVEQAREIELMARQLTENFQEYQTAAALYRRAAQLYGEADGAADAWAMAGRLAFYGGDNRGVSDLRKAGEAAEASGRSAFAAQAFRDASWVAWKHGMDHAALELATRAEQVAAAARLGEHTGAIMDQGEEPVLRR